MRDPVKAAARRRRYRERQKVAKYGPESIGVNMSGRHGNHARGPANARYRGGEMRTSEGYVAVKVAAGHHLRQAHGYAYQHRLVAEETLGRRLGPDEVVHHRNGVRHDNRPENLEVTTRGEHAREHGAHPEARDDLGRFKPGRRHDPAEWPEDLRVREFPVVESAP